MCRLLFALPLALMFAGAAHAAPVEQLRCLDDQLSDTQRAGIADMFAPQPADPLVVRHAPRGTAGAARDLATALGSCAAQFQWSPTDQGLATQYLIRRGALSKLRLEHAPQWGSALDRYYPIAVRMLGREEKVSDYSKRLIAAGARANGLSVSDSEEERDAVAAYLSSVRDVETTRFAFATGRAN